MHDSKVDEKRKGFSGLLKIRSVEDIFTVGQKYV